MKKFSTILSLLVVLATFSTSVLANGLPLCGTGPGLPRDIGVRYSPASWNGMLPSNPPNPISFTSAGIQLQTGLAGNGLGIKIPQNPQMGLNNLVTRCAGIPTVSSTTGQCQGNYVNLPGVPFATTPMGCGCLTTIHLDVANQPPPPQMVLASPYNYLAFFSFWADNLQPVTNALVDDIIVDYPTPSSPTSQASFNKVFSQTHVGFSDDLIIMATEPFQNQASSADIGIIVPYLDPTSPAAQNLFPLVTAGAPGCNPPGAVTTCCDPQNSLFQGCSLSAKLVVYSAFDGPLPIVAPSTGLDCMNFSNAFNVTIKP